MKIKKIIEVGLLSAIAVILHIVEAHMPPLLPVMGAKLGLSNVMTLICFELFGVKEAACLLFIRIMLTTVFSGAVVSMIMSVFGAVFCLAVMYASKKVFGIKNIVVLSVIASMGHNAGQITAASIVLKSSAVWFYFPVLIAAGCLFGVFTGFCADFFVRRIRRI